MVIIEENKIGKIRDWHRFRYKVYEMYIPKISKNINCKNKECILNRLLVAADSAQDANRIIRNYLKSHDNDLNNLSEIDEKNWQHQFCDECGLIEKHVGYDYDILRHYGKAILSCFRKTKE